uniref:Uncharacterized protein n=1 Tax=Aegilops tauschii subsp. strangulata TaxID=200361 RepID=A0A452ZXS8_AEGTS
TPTTEPPRTLVAVLAHCGRTRCGVKQLRVAELVLAEERVRVSAERFNVLRVSCRCCRTDVFVFRSSYMRGAEQSCNSLET